MGTKPIGRKTYYNLDNIPKIKEIWKNSIEQKLTLKETHKVFLENNFDVKPRTVKEWKKKLGFVKKRLIDREYNKTFPLQRLEYIEDEEWQPLKVEELICHGYKISQYGNILGKKGKKLRWTSSRGYPFCCVSLSVDDFKDIDYKPTPPSPFGYAEKNQRIQGITIHRVMANIYIPKPIPECFLGIWNTLTDEQKKWIQSVYIVDHIDNNKGNVSIDNLQWITPPENNHYFKKQRQSHEENSINRNKNK
jgi:hypothetical protein